MSIKNLIRSEEVVCYDKILNCYLKHKGNRSMIEMCKNRSIIRLMDKLRQRNDRRLVQNTLLLVLSLYDDHPPDLYSSLGKDVDTLNDKKEKRELLSELKKEFIS
jgi:hypothetical protein